MSLVETATTLLFVPADRPERFAKALASDADLAIIDLEDAVAADSKQSARAAILASGPDVTAHVAIRINPLGTRDADRDVELLTALAGPATVIVPKAENPAALTALHQRLRAVPLIPLIETAAGLACVREIAAASGVARLAFGHLDFAADLGCRPDGALITQARCEVVIASRLAGLVAPIDSIVTELDDPAVVAADARRGAELGFGGKLCIHPQQVQAAAAAFQPDEAELAWARGVVVAADGGAARVGSEMVDAPLVKRARTILELAGRR